MKLLIALENPMPLYVAPAWLADRLREHFPSVEITVLAGPERMQNEIAGAEVLFVQSLKREQFLAARALRWVHCPSAAVHQFMFAEFVASNVALTNGSEVHAPAVAEHVMAMMFALARRIPESVRFQQKHAWGQGPIWDERRASFELAGSTLGLVGLGSIGRNVAERAAAIGMRVIAVREHPEKPRPEFVEEVLPTSRLNEMLSSADYVVLSPPVTPATKGMIGGEQLAAMKPDAYLINVGRGPLTDEAALIEALRARKIAGAALDVFDQEPLPADSPLWDLDNLLITPHTGGFTEKMWERQYSLFAENLGRYLNAEPLLGLVDKHRGY